MRTALASTSTALLAASLAAACLVAAGASTAAATAPGTNGKIAYVTNKDGNDEIYAVNPDGTGDVNLTRDAAADIDPTYSPGGGKIAFVSNRAGNWDIWEMYADGSKPTQITTHAQSDRYPSWSPDGTRIAYRSNAGGSFDIHVMNADGSGDHVIARDDAFDSEPAWSPDGTTIAFVSERVTGTRQIWAVNADGTNPRQLTSAGTNRFPTWSPDGAQIAFVSDRDGYEQLYAMAPDGSDQHRILASHHSDRYPVYSPDGTQVAFRSSNTAGQQAIFLMNADGTNVHQLTADSARDIQPSWQTVPQPSSGGTPEAPITSILPQAGGGGGPQSGGGGARAGTQPQGTLGGGLARLSLTHLRATPRRFSSAVPSRCAAHPTSTSCRLLQKRLGTSLRFSLSGRARVTFTVWTRSGRTRHRLSSFTRTGVLGANRTRFAGRTHARALTSGAYTITAVAGRGARQSAPASVRVAVRNN